MSSITNPDMIEAKTCASIFTELRLSAEQAGSIAALSKALGHPVRVQIVDVLRRYGGEVCVCDIERHFDLTQPTISHHLRVLREAGVIEGSSAGCGFTTGQFRRRSRRWRSYSATCVAAFRLYRAHVFSSDVSKDIYK